MKKFLIFIILLASKHCFSCGFYPCGESVRFSFFYPDTYNSYNGFNYNSYSFSQANQEFLLFKIQPNEKLWVDYCKNKVPYLEIRKVLEEFSYEDISNLSTNKMLQYLYKRNDNEAIEYLKFAKKCQQFTILDETIRDPWEKNQNNLTLPIQKLINQAEDLSKTLKNKQLRLRYAFLGIRLGFYSSNPKAINNLFNYHFKNTKNKNILYYWSLYFYSYNLADKALVNFNASQIYFNAPNKRFAVYGQLEKNMPISSMIKFAKNKEELANIYLYKLIRKQDKTLKNIEQVYKINAKAEGLGFLLLREVNKIEDWVFTPYYTLFEPSLENNYREDYNVQKIFNRSENDRKYAQEVLNFINSINLDNTDNPIFWQSAKAHLLFIVRDYNSSLSEINNLEQKISKNDSIYSQLQITKALDLTANQSFGKAKILDKVKPILLKNQDDKEFLFAIGRELEYLGNKTDAALLYSNLVIHNNAADDYYEGYPVSWKTLKHRKGSYRDYFYDYFGYIDVLYTPEQTENIINAIAKNGKSKNKFEQWKYGEIAKDISKLYDLLGTKYIRQNKLDLALKSFEKVDSKYWISYNECLWEYKESNGLVFDLNPFTDLGGSAKFDIDIKLCRNKKEVTAKLIHFLEKANNPKDKNRDLYYFLVANCYKNMTNYGNSWMMRRFGVSDYDVDPFPEDEKEFQEHMLSKKYYLLAYKYAKNKKFKALCIRLSSNYKKLENEFPDDYNQLTYSCDAFQEYFNSRV